MKARVHIFYKDSVFDPQGHTLAMSLQRIGFREVDKARVGKVVDLEINDTAVGSVEQKIQEMCEKLLANPVIEKFSYEIIES